MDSFSFSSSHHFLDHFDLTPWLHLLIRFEIWFIYCFVLRLWLKVHLWVNNTKEKHPQLTSSFWNKASELSRSCAPNFEFKGKILKSIFLKAIHATISALILKATTVKLHCKQLGWKFSHMVVRTFYMSKFSTFNLFYFNFRDYNVTKV